MNATPSDGERRRQAKVAFRVGLMCTLFGGLWLAFVASPAVRRWCYDTFARDSALALPPDVLSPHVTVTLGWMAGATWCFVRAHRLSRPDDDRDRAR